MYKMNSRFLYHAWGLYNLELVERNTKVIQFSCTPTLKSHKPHVPSAAIAICRVYDFPQKKVVFLIIIYYFRIESKIV